MTLPTTASLYTDFQALTRLKGAARQQSPEALRETARQFEAVFLQQLLKSMRSAGAGEGGLLDSEQSRFYRDMFDQQLALTLAESGRLGLADMIMRELGREGDTSQPVAIPIVPQRLEWIPARPAAPARAPTPATTTPASRSETSDSPEPTTQLSVQAAPPEVKPASPEAFVQHMWPHAQKAAHRIGVAPEVLIAQAALESAWGKAVPRFSDGRSSHNLFGIKSHGRWQGERVVNATLEFVNGLPERRREGFRAYPSYAESFADYVDFLQSNPRYTEALNQTADSRAFIRALHRAGYATDPHYAGKIERILDGPTFARALDSLKLAADRPITSQEG